MNPDSYNSMMPQFIKYENSYKYNDDQSKINYKKCNKCNQYYESDFTHNCGIQNTYIFGGNPQANMFGGNPQANMFGGNPQANTFGGQNISTFWNQSNNKKPVNDKKMILNKLMKKCKKLYLLNDYIN